MKTNDTIAAISSGLSSGGIGIIRISGPESIDYADRIFKGKISLKDAPSHTVHYGHIVYDNKTYDEVMVMVLRAPATYTREDVVEIDCHGGIYIIKEILALLISLGVRIAEPGEFTKRAFLNGRIDLSQAESVMDIIASGNERALNNSLKQLDGRLSDKIRALREKILYEIAFIESGLDDPEHFSFDGYGDNLREKLISVNKDISRMIRSFDEGSIIKNGIQTAIIGKPNVGKSSLLNLLSNKEKSIVTDIPGTTRDIVEEQILLDGIQLNIMDTAGIRDTSDLVESIGVKKSFESIDKADLVIYMIDASDEDDAVDDNILKALDGKKYIILINKTDISDAASNIKVKDLKEDYIEFSIKEERGKEDLINKIKHMFYNNEIDSSDIYITNLRHKTLLEDSEKSIELVINSIDNGMPEDFYSIDLMDAYTSLGKILGEAVEDDLVEKIFSEFCMGK